MLVTRIEESVSVLKKWQSEHHTPGTSEKRKRELEPSPSETDRGAKKKCPPYKKVPPRSSLVEVVITYPNQLDPKLKKRVEKVSSEFSGMVENLAKGKLTTFVSTSLENLKAFSYEALDDELSRKTPWLYTTINTATGGSTVHNCVAASVALRGRNPRLSALAYVINSTLTQGGVKPIFKRLSKMGITTTHSNVLNKQKEMRAAGYNNIKCWREDCELFFQHSASGEVCPRPPPTAKPTKEAGREEEEEDGGPVEEEFEIELDWGPLEEEGEGEEEEWSPVSEETEREEDRGSTEQGETEREEDGGSTEEEERGEEAEWGSLLGETEREEEEGRTSSVLEGNDRREEDSDSTVDSETEYFGLNLTCESD
ncbi:hypothetical protein J4Q44_G00339860 [Coregonus suidteri]|uniref:Uncharacterized protein n=1 Tax=Coregonus suidteri TaxID=861788 RepID=A0AAN8KQS9_9TELE